MHSPLVPFAVVGSLLLFVLAGTGRRFVFGRIRRVWASLAGTVVFLLVLVLAAHFRVTFLPWPPPWPGAIIGFVLGAIVVKRI